MASTLRTFRLLPAWILAIGQLLVACDSSQTSIAQQTDSQVNRQAQMLLVAAAEAFNAGDFNATLSKCKEVAALLPGDARVQQRAAELLYLSGHAKESVPLFDKAIELEPKKAASNWQRGIALATIGDFKRGAEQFKIHHDVNPNDVENSAWYFLCVAKTDGIPAAKKTIIGSQGDPRPPMMNVLRMLRGEETPEQVVTAAEKIGPDPENRKLAQFYADLYVGLYYDSIDRTDEAEKYLKRCLEHKTAGYMYDTARVYLADRFQKSKSTDSKGKP